MIYLTSETRWKAERDEEKCFLKNYPSIKEIKNIDKRNSQYFEWWRIDRRSFTDGD